MTEKLVEALKEKKLIVGAGAAQKSMIAGELEEIFLAANCHEQMREKFKSRAGVSEMPVTELERTSEEIGALCKKPFAITVAAIKKTKE